MQKNETTGLYFSYLHIVMKAEAFCRTNFVFPVHSLQKKGQSGASIITFYFSCVAIHSMKLFQIENFDGM